MNFNKLALGYENIILKHKKCIVKSRSECDVSTTIGGKKIKVPCFASNMKSIINEDICQVFDQNGWFHVFQRVDEDKIFPYVERANKENWNFVSISVGIKPFYFDLLDKIKSNGYRLDSVEIDLALGFTDEILPIVEYLRKNFGKVNIIAGNGDSQEFINFLARNDVDCAKINIGVSSACRTKEFVGFSSSTITDLERCYDQSLQSKVYFGKEVKIISDGGLTVKNNEVWIGDLAKSIRFGASYIQSGALFSRCIDSPAIINGYFGNASQQAKQSRNHIEGTTLNVNSNGLTIKQMMSLIEESLQSSVSYAGGTKLEDLRGVDYQLIF